MALRLKQEITQGLRTAKVYWDNEWLEFRVKFFREGKHELNSDYHTNELSDAVSTASWQIGAIC